MQRPAKHKVVPHAAIWHHRTDSLNSSTDVCNPHRFYCSIGDLRSRLCARQVHPVRDRCTEIWAAIDAIEAIFDSHQGTDITNIAIRIPPGGCGNHECALEVIIPVEECHLDDGVIWDDVAPATELVIAILVLDVRKGLAPVAWIGGMPCPNVIDEAAELSSLGNVQQGKIQNLVTV